MKPPSVRVVGRDLAAARLSYVLLLVWIAVAVMMAALGERKWDAYFQFGLSREGVADGRVWQFVSYGFLHGNGAHLILNAVALVLVGMRLERIGGAALLARLMLAGILAGGWFHLMLGGPGEEGRANVLVGGSGGVVAGVLYLTGVSPGSRMWPLPISGRNLGRGLLGASLILVLCNPALDLPGLSRLGEWAGHWVGASSHACHLGGGLAGWAYARWMLRPRVTLARLQRERERREGPAPPR